MTHARAHLATRHFVSVRSVATADFRRLIERSRHWRNAVHSKQVDHIFGSRPDRTSPLTLGMIFEKPSNRTRVSFEMAMHHFGGKALYLSPQEIGLGKREAVEDVAAVLGRYVDAIMARVFRHADILTLSNHAGVPVINGLSDEAHPCQALGDFLTMVNLVPDLSKATLTFVGDGNNVCNSLIMAAAHCGTKFRWIGPPGYEPSDHTLRSAASLGASMTCSNRMIDLEGSDFIYTDVWASMGQEEEAEARRKIFTPYRLDAAATAQCPSAWVLHCLPAHRGEEITDDVIESEKSVVIDQAENRVYAQMAVLERALA